MSTSEFWWSSGAEAGGGGGGGAAIGQSLRFRGTAAITSPLITTGSDGQEWCMSFWIKKGSVGSANASLFQDQRNGYPNGWWYSNGTSYDSYCAVTADVSGAVYIQGTAVQRDYSAWYHIFMNKQNGNNTGECWINGEKYCDASTHWDDNDAITWAGYAGNSRDFYLADYHFVSGNHRAVTDFGRFNDNGVWVPVDPGLTQAEYGADGWHLDFHDPANIGEDVSGNGNDFTATGFDTSSDDPTYDLMQDSPTNNFATINPLYPGASTSNANLNTANTTGNPTILGLAGNVGVGGVSTAWDGTEAGWTSTGHINFGQQPSGFDDIQTQNMPTPTVPNGRDHFRAITAAGGDILTNARNTFADGLWWIKDRANSNQHQLVDVMNGTTDVWRLPAMNGGHDYAAPAGDSVAWCWRAGDSDVANTDGTIASTVRANPDAGFSIVQWTGNETAGSVGHGLNGTPDFVIGTGYTGNLVPAWHSAPTPAGGYFYLGGDAAWATNLDIWNSANMSATTIGVSNNPTVNANGQLCTAYVWTAIPGYSAFGSYTGNGTADGPFVYTGFRPAWVMTKSTNHSYQWMIVDSTRNVANPVNSYLFSNLVNAEQTAASFDLDFLSNGFKLRSSTATDNNASNITYIYAAFAENPFQSPVTAR